MAVNITAAKITELFKAGYLNTIASPQATAGASEEYHIAAEIVDSDLVVYVQNQTYVGGSDLDVVFLQNAPYPPYDISGASVVAPRGLISCYVVKSGDIAGFGGVVKMRLTPQNASKSLSALQVGVCAAEYKFEKKKDPDIDDDESSGTEQNGTVGIDTYITAAEADEIICSRHDTQTQLEWLNISEVERAKLLRIAAEHIDSLAFHGQFEKANQSMAFPRKNIGTPKAIKTAQAEIALRLLQDNLSGNTSSRAQLQAQGVKSYSIGDLSETFGDTSAKPYALQDHTIAALLQRYLSGGYAIC